jgi:acyl-CoA dehydrogenase
MPSYKAPVADTMFLLTDVFGLHRYENLPRFADAQLDVVEAVLSEGGKLAEEVLQPLNLSGDQEGCRRLPDGSVVTPKGFREAYKAYVEGGWVGMPARQPTAGKGFRIF